MGAPLKGSEIRGAGRQSARRVAPVAAVAMAFTLTGCGGVLFGGGGKSSGPKPGKPAASAKAAASSLSTVLATTTQEPATTFKLTYTVRSKTIPTVVTMEQLPPKQLFKWGTTEVVLVGKLAYDCTTKPVLSCTPPGYFNSSPMQGMVNVFSASTYASYIQSWQQLLKSGTKGYKVSVTSETFAGQPSQCVSWNYQGSNDKYCITRTGVLAFVGLAEAHGHNNYSFWLSSYSTKVSGADFALPKGVATKLAPTTTVRR